MSLSAIRYCSREKCVVRRYFMALVSLFQGVFKLRCSFIFTPNRPDV